MILNKKEKERLISELSDLLNDKDFDKTDMFEFYISNDLITIFERLNETIKTKKNSIQSGQKDIEYAQDIRCLNSTIDSITYLQEKYLG